MLYFFDPAKHELDPVDSVDAAMSGVKEVQIEQALAHRPESLFKAARDGKPVLVVKTSAPCAKMPDVVALDAEGRLVLIECKRGWATRDTLAQLLDYAADYGNEPFRLLEANWDTGTGASSPGKLLDHFRRFADDETAAAENIGKEQVLVVVAAARDDAFEKIAAFLRHRGVVVHFVPACLFRRGNGDLFLDVQPIHLSSREGRGPSDGGKPVWMINTDETHSPGAHGRFVQSGVAAIWGYPDGPATLQQGAKAGDTIYAYLNERGIVARGTVVDGEVIQAPPGTTVFPEATDDGNEWHLRVEWKPLPTPISNAEVRLATRAGLPVRNSFCRLWNEKVRAFLEKQSR